MVRFWSAIVGARWSQAALADDSAGMTQLANYLGHRGSYAAAMQLHQRIVDARDQALGPEQPETLTARNNLAHWTRLAAREAEPGLK